MKNKVLTTNSERGNALFLILIAVALFAALSYAVTQSGRSSGSIDRETAMIAASQITQYPATLDTTITRMIITGTDVSRIHFDHDTHSGDGTRTDEGNVFHTDGGSATRSTPPSNIGAARGTWPDMGTLSGNTWGFKDVSNTTMGYYVFDLGSNAELTGREAFAFLNNIKLGVCEQINKGLNLAYDPLPNQSVPVDYEANSGLGDTGSATDGGSSNTFGALPGEPFGCVQMGDDASTAYYDYYHALIEQ